MRNLHLRVRFKGHNFWSYSNDFAIEFMDNKCTNILFSCTLNQDIQTGLMCYHESLDFNSKTTGTLVEKFYNYLETQSDEIVRRFNHCLFDALNLVIHRHSNIDLVITQEMAIFKYFGFDSRITHYYKDGAEDIPKAYALSVQDALSHAKFIWFNEFHVGKTKNIDEAVARFATPYLYGSLMVDTETAHIKYHIQLCLNESSLHAEQENLKRILTIDEISELFAIKDKDNWLMVKEPDYEKQQIGLKKLVDGFDALFKEDEYEIYINHSGFYKNIDEMQRQFSKKLNLK